MSKTITHHHKIKTEDFAEYVRDLAGELRGVAETLGMRQLADALDDVCEEAAVYHSPGKAAPDDAA